MKLHILPAFQAGAASKRRVGNLSRVFGLLILLAYPAAGFSVARPPSLTAVLKHTVVQPGFVYDDFGKVEVRDPGDTKNPPYWWVINNGDGGQLYQGCGDATCITAEKVQSLKFARLELSHDSTPAVWDGLEYNGTEISEYRTMYSSGLPGRWFPTYGHPVTISANVRFSPNYVDDGSGGAVGSAGLWLWNSYPDPLGYQPVNAFGFNWAEGGAAGGLDGLQITALRDTVPVFSQRAAASVDMSTWHEWEFGWSADADGNQSLEWWLDGVSIAQTTLDTPYPPLSLTFWNDNQFAAVLENGEYTVVMHNPAAEQDFDIDWVQIDQPQ